MKRVAAVIVLSLLPIVTLAGVTEVKLKLPLKPKLSIGGGEKIAIAPFVIANREKKNDRASKVDIQAEFQRYLKKQLTKSTKLRLVDVPQTRLPGTTMKALEASRDFWRNLGSQTGADFIVSGVIDFDVNDKSGYKTEEYVSPADGRTYYRQVLIETTGFVFDIDI
ncbi:MAG TPA: hypothetical protein VHX14_22430, partial [Thermoanaerobaculia bacterium]|nr:hypothetical protein [Thermoanaerobaculia bacterium]